MGEKRWMLGQIAKAIGAALEGDAERSFGGLAALDTAGPDDLSFVVDARRATGLAECRAAAVLAPEGMAVPAHLAVLRVKDVEAAVAAVLGLLAEPEDLPPPGVHPTAVVDPTAEIGAGVAIGPCAVVGPNVVLGDGVVLSAHVCLAAGVTVGEKTVLMPGAVIRERCRIGRRCRIHANAVIGTDGFGYYQRAGVHHKVPHVGTVEIGDDVEIGACTCIDRAKFGATRVGDGSKIDNLVMIAHNVQLGRGALLAGFVGIAGSAKLGDYVVLGGHTGIRDNVVVGDRSMVAAYSAALSDVPADTVFAGIPGIPLEKWRRIVHTWTRLPEMRQVLKDLQARINALESATNDDQH